MTKIKMSDRMEMVPLKDIRPYKRNPRNNTEAVPKVAESILKFGFRNPIILDKENVVIAGHTRLLAAKKLGLKEVPCIWANDLTPDEVKALRLVDNKTAEYAEWELDLLSEELNDINLDLSAFDFDIDMATDDSEPIEVQEDDFDESVEVIEHGIVEGDVWQLGDHRVMCGDSTDFKTIKILMDGNIADLGFCDPPYNLGFEYNSYDDNKTDEEYAQFSHKWYNILKINAKRKIVTLGTKNIGLMAELDEITGVGCWVKKNWITSCKIANLQQWEPIFMYGDFSQFKRTTDLFEINRVVQKDVGKNHTCPKQIKLIADIVENYSNIHDKVVDFFGGSGTTLIACEQLHRQCYMMELDPHYCDVIISRWEKLTGQQAVKVS